MYFKPVRAIGFAGKGEKSMGRRSIVEEEYQRILKGMKYLPGNENLYGQGGFSAVIKPDYLTDSERSMKELEDALGSMHKRIDFLTGWGDKTDAKLLIETWNSDWLKKDNRWVMEKSPMEDLDDGDYYESFLKRINGYYLPLREIEEKTFKMAGRLSMDVEIPFTSAQLSAIDSISAEVGDKWKDLIAPDSFLSDYQKLIENQHKAIQKAFQRNDIINIDSRLGMLDAASKFVDRQVEWTSDFLVSVQTQLEDDREDIIDAGNQEIKDAAWDEKGIKTEERINTPSTLSKIPQYIAYTNRKDLHITPEEGLGKSILVEITEMGKRIIANAMAINNLCECKDRDMFFKPTNKLVTGAVEIATITCTSKDELGKIIDALYFLLYENLERIKKVVTDQAVRSESVYECIFAVKSIRTDFRHDFEHGKEVSIKKKRKEINDCYKKYCGKIPLKQKDFSLLQKNLFKDILVLEGHLMEKLEELQDDPE